MCAFLCVYVYPLKRFFTIVLLSASVETWYSTHQTYMPLYIYICLIDVEYKMSYLLRIYIYVYPLRRFITIQSSYFLFLCTHQAYMHACMGMKSDTHMYSRVRICIESLSCCIFVCVCVYKGRSHLNRLTFDCENVAYISHACMHV